MTDIFSFFHHYSCSSATVVLNSVHFGSRIWLKFSFCAFPIELAKFTKKCVIKNSLNIVKFRALCTHITYQKKNPFRICWATLKLFKFENQLVKSHIAKIDHRSIDGGTKVLNWRKSIDLRVRVNSFPPQCILINPCDLLFAKDLAQNLLINVNDILMFAHTPSNHSRRKKSKENTEHIPNRLKFYK